MGGNAVARKRFVNDKGEPAFKKDENGDYIIKDGDFSVAQKIDMSKISRKDLSDEIVKALRDLNDEVKKESKDNQPLWRDFKNVENGLAFNGSTRLLMRHSEISDREFVKLKPKVGDIDISFPREKAEDLFNTLLKFEDTGKKFGNFEYIGNNKLNPSDKQQINAIFKFEYQFEDTVFQDENGDFYDSTGIKISRDEIIEVLT